MFYVRLHWIGPVSSYQRTLLLTLCYIFYSFILIKVSFQSHLSANKKQSFSDIITFWSFWIGHRFNFISFNLSRKLLLQYLFRKQKVQIQAITKVQQRALMNNVKKHSTLRSNFVSFTKRIKETGNINSDKEYLFSLKKR
jgi:hypothetical protein